MLNSSPYYAQANGQDEASNKGIIKLIKRKIEENPRRWHTLLNEALWSYQMACHGSTKVSVFSPRGVTPMSKLVCVLPFPDGYARKDTKIYPGSGKRRPYVQRGGEVLVLSCT